MKAPNQQQYPRYKRMALMLLPLFLGGLFLSAVLLLPGCASVRDAQQTRQQAEAAAEATAHFAAVQQAAEATISAMPQNTTASDADPPLTAVAVAVLPTAPGIEALDAIVAQYDDDLTDRLTDPGQIDSANYRIDHPGWIGATGRPQLLVFYSFPDGDSLRGCIDCSYYFPVIYELEVALWGQVDVIHLHNNDSVIPAIMETYGFNRAEGRWSIGMVLVDAEGNKVRLYRGMMRYEDQTPFDSMMSSIQINLAGLEEDG